MAVLQTFTKQPWEVKDYDIDYSQWLNAITTPDSISSVTTAVTCETTPSGAVTLLVDSTAVTATRAKLVISGGTSGKKYKVTVRMTTAGVDGIVRKDESELMFNVTDT